MTQSVPAPRADEAMLLSPILNGVEPALTASEEPRIALSPSGIDVDDWRSDSKEVD